MFSSICEKAGPITSICNIRGGVRGGVSGGVSDGGRGGFCGGALGTAKQWWFNANIKYSFYHPGAK